jgi:segregation and condensation protein A
MDYRVELDIFRGPLDLLLYLVRKDELDIFDIPLSRLTEQYLAYLKILEMIDVDVAGDFLVMAATLMEIKSRMLLPRVDAPDDPDADPRMQLVRQLLEYKKFRDAAEGLRELAEEQRKRFARIPVERLHADGDLTTEPIRDVEMWDLVSAFGRLMRQTLALKPRSIVYDETPIEVYMADILERLRRERRFAFWSLFEGEQQRGPIVGRLLAVLELVKSKQVEAEQEAPFGEIWLTLIADTEPARLSDAITEVTQLAVAEFDTHGAAG